MKLANEIIIQKLMQLVADLIAGDYLAMERDGKLRQNTAEGTAEKLALHPGSLTMPPRTCFEDVVAIWETATYGSEKNASIVVINLWLSGQKGDLVLEARCAEMSDQEIVVTVHDIL